MKDTFGLTDNVKTGMHLAITLVVLVTQAIAMSYEPCKIVLVGGCPDCTGMLAKSTMLRSIGSAVLLVKLAHTIIPIAVYDSKHLASLEWHLDYVLVG